MTAATMTSRSDIVRAAYAESQLALAQQHNAALGAAWCGGTLAEGIARKCAWLESLINDVEKSQ